MLLAILLALIVVVFLSLTGGEMPESADVPPVHSSPSAELAKESKE